MIQPTVIIEVPGNHTIFSTAFSGDSGKVYAEVTYPAVNLWAVLVYHWPELFGVVLIVALVGCALKARRVMSRPMRRGSRYCRRCGYEVGEGLGRCPECGTRLAGRAVVLGRGRLRRLLPQAFAAIVVGGAYGAMLAGGVARINAVCAWLDWSSVRLHRWATANGVVRLVKVPWPYRQIVEIDAVTGRITRTLFEPGGYWEFPLVTTPDCQSLLFTDRRGRLVLLDPSTGRIRRALPRPDGRSSYGSKWGTGWHHVAGFSDDGTAVYVSFYDDRTGSTSLVRWDLLTGAHREVMEVSPPGQGPHMLIEVERRFFVVPGTDGARIAAIPCFSSPLSGGYGDSSDVAIHDTSVPGAPVIQRITGPFWSGSSLHFTKDGSHFLRKTWDDSWSEWDLARGQQVASGSGPGFGGTLTDTIALDAQRERMIVGSTGALELHSRHQRAWQATGVLALPPGALPRETFDISPNGRWLAVCVFPGATGRYAIALYDLSPASP